MSRFKNYNEIDKSVVFEQAANKDINCIYDLVAIMFEFASESDRVKAFELLHDNFGDKAIEAIIDGIENYNKSDRVPGRCLANVYFLLFPKAINNRAIDLLLNEFIWKSSRTKSVPNNNIAYSWKSPGDIIDEFFNVFSENEYLPDKLYNLYEENSSSDTFVSGRAESWLKRLAESKNKKAIDYLEKIK